MVWGLLSWELKEHTKPCKPIQKRIFGDKIGDFELCLMGYTGAEVIAYLTGDISSSHLRKMGMVEYHEE